MNFICQQNTLNELQLLADSDRHSILIEGPEGSGKTYLAMQYASMLNISDFQVCSPKVDDIKSAIDMCLQLSSPIVLTIENLDTGVLSAAYTLLKFLEEPLPNVYIIVTCRNIQMIPDTIISRSAMISVGPPVDTDITTYASNMNFDRYNAVCNMPLWRCVRTFKDAATILNMTPTAIEYFNSINIQSLFKDTVSNIVWKLGHYPDNSECPVDLLIRYIMEIDRNAHTQSAGISCIRDMSQGRVAKHSVLAKFAFEMKYCE